MDSDTQHEEIIFLSDLVKSIIEFPNEVAVNRTKDDMGILLTLQVAQTDMGKVIGKEGQTASAIRHLVACWGYKRMKKLSVKILEPIK